MGAGVEDNRNQTNRVVRLYGFLTGSAQLDSLHKEWLDRFVVEPVQAVAAISVIGMASRVGPDRMNMALSERRARTVVAMLNRRCPPDALHFVGVGEQHGETGGENEERHRAVIILRNQGIIHLPGIQIIGAPPPRDRTTTFWIKYGGSVAVGSGIRPSRGLAVEGAHFMIRDGSNYWQKYDFVGLNGGYGFPFSWGQALPMRQGWVEFSTPTLRTVSEFAGLAHLYSEGIQLHRVGESRAILEFGRRTVQEATIRLNLATGPGFTIGVGLTEGRLSLDGGRRRSSSWETY